VSRPFAIGVDVGGTHAKLVLVSTDGAVAAERRIDSGRGATSAMLAPAIVAAIQAILASASVSWDQVTALGLVVPGFVDPARARSLFSPNTPGLTGDAFPKLLSHETGLPVTFDSDVNAAAFGEAAWGAGRDVPRFLTLTFGTGVGGGFVVHGSLVRISGGTIGDIGHVILDPAGRRCSAGCAGCAEALVGAEGLVEIAREAGAPAAIDRPALVIDAVGSGEAWALRTAHRVGHLAGILIASLMPILLPDRVAVVGGTTAMGLPFFDSMRATVDAIGGRSYVRDRAIVQGRFAAMAGAVGAAALALQERRQVSGC
jgi:glucokinase